MARELSRRSFLRSAAAGAALIPLVSVGSRQAWAAERVSTDDPTAKALGYVEEASEANRTAKAGVPGEEQNCANCALYTGEGEWAPCTLFQGREVKGSGWCSAWVPKG
jgi:hypothetical protein